MKTILVRQFKATRDYLKGRSPIDGCLLVTTLVLGFVSLTVGWAYCIYLVSTRGFWSKTCHVFSRIWLRVHGTTAALLQPVWFPLVASCVFICAFALCLYLLRRFWTGILVSLAMFLFGMFVYIPAERTNPPELAGNHRFAHQLAVADNALSAFFMSRGDYVMSSGDQKTNNVNMAACASSTNGDGGKRSNDDISVPWHETVLACIKKFQREPFSYYLFHALCYAYGAAFLCTVFGRRLVNIFWLYWFYVFKRKIAVFWDAGPESLRAIRAEKADNDDHAAVSVVFRKNCPFSLKRERTPDEENLDIISVPWIYLPPAKFSEAKSFSKREVKWLSSAVRHYWLGPDEQSNVETANELLTSQINPEAKFFIRIDADSEKDVLFGWADRQAALSGSASKPSSPEIILVHEPSLVAAKWIENYPILDLPGEAESNGVRLLMIGCGALGKAIMRETVQSGLRPGKTFSATVVDKAESSFEPFRSFWNELKKNAGAETESFCIGATFDFNVKDVADPDFWDVLLRERNGGPRDGMRPPEGWTRVVFALPDDLANLRMAAEFMRQMRTRNLPGISSLHIFAGVRISGNADYAKYVFKNETEKISLFGDLDSVYSDLRRKRDEEDAGARYLNWRYLNPKASKDLYTEDAGRMAWRTSSFFDKESTRSAVSGLRTLARKIGFVQCDADEGDDLLTGNKLETTVGIVINRSDESKIWELAEIEHMRWCAFLLLRRIRPWHIDKEVTSDLAYKDAISYLADLARSRNQGVAKGRERPVKENDQKENLRHAALVPYDKLGQIAGMFEKANEDAGIKYKSKIATTDEDFVHSMGEVLARTKWHFKTLATIGPGPSLEMSAPS